MLSTAGAGAEQPAAGERERDPVQAGAAYTRGRRGDDER
jgi:hypothetical protein